MLNEKFLTNVSWISTAFISVLGALDGVIDALFIISLLISLFCSIYNTLIPTIRKMMSDGKVEPHEVDELVDKVEDAAEEIKETAEKLNELEDKNNGNNKPKQS